MEDTATVQSRGQGTFDEVRAKDAGTPPWDVFGRPDKPVEEYTAGEAQAEAVNLARVYLARRGFEVGPELWPAPMSGRSYLTATDEHGCAVVVRVRGRVRAEGGPGPEVPEAEPGPERSALRHDLLLWLMENDVEGAARADVVAVDIHGQRLARLRHLVGAVGWDAD